MKKTLIALIGFFIGIVVFMPKEHLFYKFLHLLKQEKIDIKTSITQTPLTLNLKNTDIYYINIKTAHIKNASILPLLFFNQIIANDISLKALDIFVKNIKITYIPFLDAKIEGKSTIGEFRGYINPKEIKIYIKNPSRKIISFLKKDNKGYFYYAKF